VCQVLPEEGGHSGKSRFVCGLAVFQLMTELIQGMVMDLVCHDLFGVGLGFAEGQRFDKQLDGRWMKVEG